MSKILLERTYVPGILHSPHNDTWVRVENINFSENVKKKSENQCKWCKNNLKTRNIGQISTEFSCRNLMSGHSPPGPSPVVADYRKVSQGSKDVWIEDEYHRSFPPRLWCRRWRILPSVSARSFWCWCFRITIGSQGSCAALLERRTLWGEVNNSWLIFKVLEGSGIEKIEDNFKFRPAI